MIIPRSWSCGHNGGIERRPGESSRNNKRLPNAMQCMACWLVEKQGVEFAEAVETARKSGVIIDPAIDGCTCQVCGKIYRIDFIVPDDVWEQIKPNGLPTGSGMLCGRCIADRMESIYKKHDNYGKFDVK